MYWTKRIMLSGRSFLNSEPCARNPIGYGMAGRILLINESKSVYEISVTG